MQQVGSKSSSAWDKCQAQICLTVVLNAIFFALSMGIIALLYSRGVIDKAKIPMGNLMAIFSICAVVNLCMNIKKHYNVYQTQLKQAK